MIFGLRLVKASAAHSAGSPAFRVCAVAVVSLALLVAASKASAQPARKWVQASQADFESGKREDVALTSIGELKLGRHKETVMDEAGDLVWALAVDSKGTVYAATGSNGEIFKIAGGRGELFYKSAELEILSLAVDKADNLYAGTAPNGLIYKFAAAGDVELYLDSEEQYIWGLALDGKGALYAATGDKGKLLKITGKGESKSVFETEKPHLLDVAIDSKDNVYTCTSEGGLVFRIDPDGKAFVLFDSEDEDMHCLAVDDEDNVYVCTADGTKPGTAGFPPRGEEAAPALKEVQPGPAEARETTERDESAETNGGEEPPGGDADMPRPLPIPTEPPPGPRPPEAVAPAVEGINFVYKITPDGMVTSIFRREGMALLSMAYHDGSIYVGTGSQGQLLRIDGDLHVTILTQVEQPYLPSLAAAADGALYFGTAAEGKVYRLGNELAEEGLFTSMVKDVSYPSQWGVIRYAGDLPGGASVHVSTRAGNVAEPDEKTWSDWSEEQADPAGVKVSSPNGRFFQYRLRLKAGDAGSPTVRSVEVYYLPPNYRPRITAIVFPPSQDGQPPAQPGPTGSVAATQKGAAAPVRGTVEISWQAEDSNNDQLEFEVFFRGADESSWKLIAEDLREPKMTWSTVRVPDGVYRLKVRAHDSLSNPAGRALATEEISEPFIVDNSPPSVADIELEVGDDGALTVTARLIDATSPIQDAVYSVDSGDWAMLAPEDGIYDAPEETLKFTTDALPAGEHTIVINTRDAAGNIGAGKVVVTIPEE